MTGNMQRGAGASARGYGCVDGRTASVCKGHGNGICSRNTAAQRTQLWPAAWQAAWRCPGAATSPGVAEGSPPFSAWRGRQHGRPSPGTAGGSPSPFAPMSPQWPLAGRGGRPSAPTPSGGVRVRNKKEIRHPQMAAFPTSPILPPSFLSKKPLCFLAKRLL